MKQIALIAILAVASAATFHGADAVDPQTQQVLALVKEIQAQQAKLSENQAALDAKLATVGEAVRIARVFAARPAR
jgi:microcompartment protein CcmK/EutM